MSSSNDLFGPEDFENLIAAVDSLEIPVDDDSPSSSAKNRPVDKVTSQSEKAAFEVKGDPFVAENSLSIEAKDEDEFDEFEDLTAEYSELNFDEESASTDTFSASTSFTSPTKQPQKAQFSVDDPFHTKVNEQTANAVTNDADIDDEDDLVDMYASFLEAIEEEPQQSDALQAQQEPAVNYFAIEDEEDQSEKFDGVAAANEISALWNEDQSEPKSSSVAAQQSEPLMDSITKTKMAASKLKAHLESLSAKSAGATTKNSQVKPYQQEIQSDGLEDVTPLRVDPEFADLVSQAEAIPVEDQILNNELENEFADLASQAEAIPVEDLTLNNVTENEFADLASQAAFVAPDAKPQAVSEAPTRADEEVLSKTVSKKVKETINISKKTEVITDNMLAAFVESTLSSKQKVRMLSLQNFARKFPKLYLGCSALLALVGFLYILAIPALFFIAMFNGFEMLNSPFTNDTIMLLTALFSISMFLFMVSYKLFDLKFVGPGGITLNHENASPLIDKIQQLKEERSIPTIHEIVLTRRHELNLIKIPRFGLPIWSKNVLAIGYPLLQTLPAEYFDVALVRRLVQFKKRKNILHNWINFMRRTWTIYAVSLKERKGVIDLLHYCFFAPYASAFRNFAVYISQKDELMADEKALQYCNDRDLTKTAQTLRITRAMLIQYFWPKLNEDLQTNSAAPHYVQPYSKLPETLNTLLRSKNVDAWFIRLGQEDVNPGDAEAPFALRMQALGQRKVAIPDAFEVNAAQHYFDDQYDKMTELLNTLWAEEVQKELFEKNIHKGEEHVELPCHLAIEPA